MADWQTLARRAARQAGVPPELFVALVGQESSGDPNAVSRAGAIGYTQLMPGTARALGVNPYNPRQNLLGGAKYLRQQLDAFHGSIPKALAAYNAGPGAVRQYGGIPPYAETRQYVRTILANAGPAGRVKPGRAPALPSPSGLGGSPISVAPDAGGGVDVSALLATLGQRKQPPASMGLQSPSFSASPALPGGYQAPASAGGPSPPTDVESLLSLVRTQGTGAAVDRGGMDLTGALSPTGAPVAASGVSRGPRGRVIVSKTANRPGVSLQQPVLDFVGRVSGIAGTPLTIGTGTNHNQYVVGTRRQSDHWTGQAADIPATGNTLTRLGQDALIAAGMPEARARKQTGGLYNLRVDGRRVQVIFNSNIGGNHYNHLHVGVR